MLVDYRTVQELHQQRVREAEQRMELHLLRDANEQAPVVIEAGWLHQIKHWIGSRNHQPRPEIRDPRRATAV